MGALIVPALTATAVVLTGVRVAPRLHPGRLPPGVDAHGGLRAATAQAGGRRRRPRRRRSGPPGPLEVAGWCDDTARALRAGSALTAALAETAAAHPAVAAVTGPVLAAIGRGRSLAEALRTAVDDPATPAGLALTVLHSCAELGGPAASPLERVAATLRARAAIADEQLAHSAQAQLSARVLTLVPVALLVVLVLTEDRIRSALVTPAGAFVVAAGAVLNLAGWWWMRRIIGTRR